MTLIRREPYPHRAHIAHALLRSDTMRGAAAVGVIVGAGGLILATLTLAPALAALSALCMATPAALYTWAARSHGHHTAHTTPTAARHYHAAVTAWQQLPPDIRHHPDTMRLLNATWRSAKRAACSALAVETVAVRARAMRCLLDAADPITGDDLTDVGTTLYGYDHADRQLGPR